MRIMGRRAHSRSDDTVYHEHLTDKLHTKAVRAKDKAAWDDKQKLHKEVAGRKASRQRVQKQHDLVQKHLGFSQGDLH